MKSFRDGITDALPVFAGYLSVGFTFGIAAAEAWDSLAIPVIASMTHISGTGQFVLVSLLNAGSSISAIVAGIVAINLRYVPMALSVSQRLDTNVPIWKRLIIALGDTDEIVGISLRQPPPLSFPYMSGLLACSWSGWTLGTLLGANPATRTVLPPDLVASLGIALPAMFAAIVFPAVRDTGRIRLAVVIAAVLSLTLRLLPVRIDPGWLILTAGIAAALIAATLRQDPSPEQ